MRKFRYEIDGMRIRGIYYAASAEQALDIIEAQYYSIGLKDVRSRIVVIEVLR